MYPMFSGIILLLLGYIGLLPSLRIFLIDPNSFPSKNSILFTLDLLSDVGLSFGGFLIVEGWGEVHVHVSVDDANGVVVVFWGNLQNVDLEFVFKC
jgi:hypothetical protein